MAPAAVQPCHERGAGTAENPWQLTRGSGFSFCLPSGWGASSSRNTYESVDANLTWAQGGGPITTVTSRPITSSTRGSSSGPYPPRPSSQTTTCVPSTRAEETIGSRLALLTTSHCAGNHQAAVGWRDPQMFIAGTARTPAGIEPLLAIYRTVRFDNVR